MVIASKQIYKKHQQIKQHRNNKNKFNKREFESRKTKSHIEQYKEGFSKIGVHPPVPMGNPDARNKFISKKLSFASQHRRNLRQFSNFAQEVKNKNGFTKFYFASIPSAPAFRWQDVEKFLNGLKSSFHRIASIDDSTFNLMPK